MYRFVLRTKGKSDYFSSTVEILARVLTSIVTNVAVNFTLRKFASNSEGKPKWPF